MASAGGTWVKAPYGHNIGKLVFVPAQKAGMGLVASVNGNKEVTGIVQGGLMVTKDANGDWAVIHRGSGYSLGGGYATKAGAMAAMDYYNQSGVKWQKPANELTSTTAYKETNFHPVKSKYMGLSAEASAKYHINAKELQAQQKAEKASELSPAKAKKFAADIKAAEELGKKIQQASYEGKSDEGFALAQQYSKLHSKWSGDQASMVAKAADKGMEAVKNEHQAAYAQKVNASLEAAKTLGSEMHSKVGTLGDNPDTWHPSVHKQMSKLIEGLDPIDKASVMAQVKSGNKQAQLSASKKVGDTAAELGAKVGKVDPGSAEHAKITKAYDKMIKDAEKAGLNVDYIKQQYSMSQSQASTQLAVEKADAEFAANAKPINVTYYTGKQGVAQGVELEGDLKGYAVTKNTNTGQYHLVDMASGKTLSKHTSAGEAAKTALGKVEQLKAQAQAAEKAKAAEAQAMAQLSSTIKAYHTPEQAQVIMAEAAKGGFTYLSETEHHQMTQGQYFDGIFTSAEKSAISAYQDGSYGTINNTLAGKTHGGAEMAAKISSAMAKAPGAPTNMQVWRGKGKGSELHAFAEQALKIKSAKPDAVVHWQPKVFESTSFEKSVAQNWGGGVLATYNVPKGLKGLPMNVMGKHGIYSSKYGSEHEWLMDNKINWRVKSVSQGSNGKMFIEFDFDGYFDD